MSLLIALVLAALLCLFVYVFTLGNRHSRIVRQKPRKVIERRAEKKPNCQNNGGKTH